MKQGIKDLRLAQLGLELVKGTPVASTVRLRGNPGMVDLSEFVKPEENIGFMGGVNDQYQKHALAQLLQPADPITFEQFPYVCNAGIRGRETGIADGGGGSGIVYTFPFPVQSSDVELIGTGIAFVNATSTITDSGSGLAIFIVGETIEVIGTVSNDGIYTVTASAAGELTVAEATADEGAGTSFTICAITRTYTLEYANNKRAFEAAYGFVSDFEIAGTGSGLDQDAVTLAATWHARQWDTTTLTPALTPQAVNRPMFSKSQLYIDTLAGTMGGTAKSGVMTGFTFTCETGVRSLFAANGQLYFANAFHRSSPVLSCDITMTHGAELLAEYDFWKAGTGRQIQIKLEGAAITAGTTYSKKTILIDMPGKWSTFPNLDDLEGADIITGTFMPSYDATPAIGPSITVVNELASLV